MVGAIWALSGVVYVIMAFLVSYKQYGVMKKDKQWAEPMLNGGLLGVIWPITLSYYIIRVVFFEDWI